MAPSYFILAVLIIPVVLLLKGVIDDWGEYKRQERLELYRRAELIGRKRLDGYVPKRSKARS